MSGWTDVEKECGPCRATAKSMTFRSCDTYCQEQGLVCAGSWRVGEDDVCQARSLQKCSEEGGRGDRQLICQCMEPNLGPARGGKNSFSNPIAKTVNVLMAKYLLVKWKGL